MNFLDTYRKIPKKYYDTEHVRLLTFISFSPQLRVFRIEAHGLVLLRGDRGYTRCKK